MKNLFEHEITLLYLCYEKGILIYNDYNLKKLFIFDILNTTTTNKLEKFTKYLANKVFGYENQTRYDSFISTNNNYFMLEGRYQYYGDTIVEIPIVNLNTYEVEACLVNLTSYEGVKDEDYFKVSFTSFDNIIAIELPKETLIYDIKEKIVIKSIDAKFGRFLTFSPENKFITTCNYYFEKKKKNYKVLILDFEKNEIVDEIDYPFDYLIKAKFSPNGKYLSLIIPDGSDTITECCAENSSLIQVYDFINRKNLYILGNKFPQGSYGGVVGYFVEEIYYSSDSKYGILTFFNATCFTIFEMETGTFVKEVISHSMAYDTKSDMLAYLVKENDKFVLKIEHLNDIINSKNI